MKAREFFELYFSDESFTNLEGKVFSNFMNHFFNVTLNEKVLIMTKWDPPIPPLYQNPYDSQNKVKEFLTDENIHSRRFRFIHPIKSPIGNFNSTVEMENKLFLLTENEFLVQTQSSVIINYFI